MWQYGYPRFWNSITYTYARGFPNTSFQQYHLKVRLIIFDGIQVLSNEDGLLRIKKRKFYFWPVRIACECYEQIWFSKLSYYGQSILIEPVHTTWTTTKWNGKIIVRPNAPLASPKDTASASSWCILAHNSCWCRRQKFNLSFSILAYIATTYCWSNRPLFKMRLNRVLCIKR